MMSLCDFVILYMTNRIPFIMITRFGVAVFSREPRLNKRVCPSVGRLVGRSVRRRAETKTANDLFRLYELVSSKNTAIFKAPSKCVKSAQNFAV